MESNRGNGKNEEGTGNVAGRQTEFVATPVNSGAITHNSPRRGAVEIVDSQEVNSLEGLFL